MRLTDEEIRTAWAFLDANSDGGVSLDELEILFD